MRCSNIRSIKRGEHGNRVISMSVRVRSKEGVSSDAIARGAVAQPELAVKATPKAVAPLLNQADETRPRKKAFDDDQWDYKASDKKKAGKRRSPH